jgi:CDP-diacylglycerol--glycerol-3-phosphate 3-phosphatidyltransferase
MSDAPTSLYPYVINQELPMDSIYQLKPYFQRSLVGLVNRAWRAGVTPNQITLAALGLSLVAGAVMAGWHEHVALFLLAPVVLLLRMGLNAMDGMLARHYQMQSPLGLLLNELGDVLADVALYLPFATLPFLSPALVVLIVIGGLCTELAGNLAPQVGAARRYDGPLGKSDRALLFSLYALVIQWGPPPPLTLHLAALAVLGLLGLTVYRRVVYALAVGERATR